MNTKEKRIRRSIKTRAKIKELGMVRLCVHRTPRHIYAQLIMPDGKAVASVSTLNKEIKSECKYGGNIVAAALVGKFIALRAKEFGLVKVAFDRSGFMYHGRIQALAENARLYGLEF